MVSLVGSSGAGKSTLLQIMGTLDFPDQGDIQFEDKILLYLAQKTGQFGGPTDAKGQAEMLSWTMFIDIKC